MIINYNFTYHASFDIISRRSLLQTHTMLLISFYNYAFICHKDMEQILSHKTMQLIQTSTSWLRLVYAHHVKKIVPKWSVKLNIMELYAVNMLKKCWSFRGVPFPMC